MDKDKEIIIGHEGRLKVKVGLDKAANAVKPTLGPIGMSAIIEFHGLDPIECDDGVTILKNLKFKDPYENMGLLKLRKAAIRTSEEGGDGTATTSVLTQALVNEAFKEIANDSSKIREVKERLDNGLIEVLNELKKIKKDIDIKDIERIATISSLDPEIAKIIAEIIQEVGVSGVVTVEKGPSLGYSKEVVKGAKFNSGLLSPYFINDPKLMGTVLEDAYIVLVDRKISTNEQILNLLNSIGTGNNILFIADTIDSVALGTLTHNAQNKIANIAGVANPYNGGRARDFLFDIAALTGATVISEEMGMKLSEADVKLCGRAEKVVVTRNSTIIIGGRPSKTSPEAINDRVESIKREISETTSEYEKNALEERLAQLTGGIGVIRVGTYTDTDFNTKKYKFDNAINACQAALQEGVVAGGGKALADVSFNINEKMFKKALIAPFNQMIINAGIVDNVNLADFKTDEGINFKTKERVDMFEDGIIDPFKTLRLALESATNIASTLIDKEVFIVTEENNNEEK